MSKQNKFLKVVVAVILSGSLTACLQGAGGGKGGASGSSGSGGAASASTSGTGGTGSTTTTTTADTPTNLIAQQVTNIGLKNFDQINETMSVLTGVLPSEVAGTATIGGQTQDGFDNLKAALPTNNDLRSYAGPTQVAILKLAGRYCYRAIRDNPVSMNNAALRARQIVLPANLLVGATTVNVNNLTQTPAQLFTPANNARIADYFIEQFWQRDPAAAATVDDSVYVQLISDLAAGETANATSSLNVLVGVCSAVLANSNVFLL